MKTHAQVKRQLLKDPAVKAEYDRLAPEYEAISAIIQKRLEKNMSQKELA